MAVARIFEVGEGS